MAEEANNKAEGAKATDAQKRERVKARWSMLRQALLGSTQNGGVDGVAGGSDRNSTTSASDDRRRSSRRFHELSMNSFPGFQVLDRTVLSRGDNNANNNGIPWDDCDESNWDLVQNLYASSKGHTIQFLTREAKTEQQQDTSQHLQKSTIQSRVEALLSHRTHGVDNTGNVRVWDAEGTLAGFLLSVIFDEGNDDPNLEENESISGLKKILGLILTKHSGDNRKGHSLPCNLLELGSGQAGLAGLAMATASLSHGNCEEKNVQMKPLHLVLTDGHPKCVANNESCAKMLSKSEDATNVVHTEAHLLLWDSSSNGAYACRQMNGLIRDSTLVTSADAIAAGHNADEGSYQLCLASDCVHFQEFHDGLLTTIARTLIVGGISLLCQPKRGTSLPNFMSLIEAVNASQTAAENNNLPCGGTNHCKDPSIGPLFQMTLVENFHPKVSTMHQTFSNDSTIRYDQNLHRPLLLVLQKLRPYDEEIDGEVARQHVKMRSEIK